MLYKDVIDTKEQIKILMRKNCNISLKYYRAAPVCFLAIIDDNMFIEFYHYGATSNERLAELIPVFKCQRPSSLYKHLAGHFEYIWTKLAVNPFSKSKKLKKI